MLVRFVFLYVDLLLDRVVAVEGDTHRIFAGTNIFETNRVLPISFPSKDTLAPAGEVSTN